MTSTMLTLASIAIRARKSRLMLWPAFTTFVAVAASLQSADARFVNPISSGSGHDNPVTSCLYSLSGNPPPQFGPDSGTDTLFIFASSRRCGWSVVSSANWVTLTAPSSGAGGGSVKYSVATNQESAPREARLTILSSDGRPVVSRRVSQGGRVCDYRVFHSDTGWPASSTTMFRPGLLTFNVSVVPECAWTATSAETWLTVVSGITGAGPGDVTVAVARNPGLYRTGSLTIASRPVEVAQESEQCIGGPPPLPPPVKLSPESRSFPAEGGTQTIRVETGCHWHIRNNLDWVDITSLSSGAGDGVVTYQVLPNRSPQSRAASLFVFVFPLGQAVHNVHQDAASTSVVQFSAASYVVNENVGVSGIPNVGITGIPITRTGALSTLASVTCVTVPGTATQAYSPFDHGDFVYTGQPIDFRPGETTKDCSISIINDTLVEGDETFTVELRTSHQGTTLGANARATVTIRDDDTVARPQYPIVFVHGLCSGSSTWDKVVGAIESQNNWKLGGILRNPDSREGLRPSPETHDFYLVNFTDPFIRGGLELWAIELQKYLRRIKEANPFARKFVIVSHSAGGLATRLYLQSPGYDDDIASLITYGTPHQGTPLGLWSALFLGIPGTLGIPVCKGFEPSFGVSQMDRETPEGERFFQNLNRPGSFRTDVFYTSLVGRSIFCSLPFLGTDCIVSTDSQNMANVHTLPQAVRVVRRVVPWHVSETDDVEGILCALGARVCNGIDLNGDGRADTFLYNRVTGNWVINLFSRVISRADKRDQTGTWSAGWDLTPADFNDDGITDFLLFNPTTGQWFKAISDGMGDFRYFTSTWSPGWTVLVLDLNGDGKSDVFLYNATTGVWMRGTSLGDGTGEFAYASGSWSPGWRIETADWDGNGLADLFLYNDSTGEWVRATNDGLSSFTYHSETWSPQWLVSTGDYTGDVLTDVFLYNQDTGQWFVAANAGVAFEYFSGTWSPGWMVNPGDLNADGLTDVFLYNPSSGQWFECFSTGSGGFTYASGFWSPNWTVQLSDLDADGRADVVLYNPGSGQYFHALNTGPGSFAYESGAWGAGWTVVASTGLRP